MTNFEKSANVSLEEASFEVHGSEHNYYPPPRTRKSSRGRLLREIRLPRVKRRQRGNVIVILSFGWLLLMVVIALIAQWLPIRSPNSIVGFPNLNPSWGREFLGTDAIGRSMVSRLAYGTRVSLEVSCLVVLVALVVGGAVGLLSVYYRGSVTVVADWIANTILSIPGLLLLLVLLVLFRPSLLVLVGCISVIFFPGFMRITRATGHSHMASEFIMAARGFGASPFRIITRELLPNTAVALITFCTLALPGAMLTEGALSYLGFGLPPPTPSWGQMIAQGQQQLTAAPWQSITPCILFVMTVFAFYTAGDWLRSRIDIHGLDQH